MSDETLLACALGITGARLSALRDGGLPAAEAERLRAHIASCAACQREVAALERLPLTLSVIRDLEPRDRVWEGVRAGMSERRGRLLPFALPPTRPMLSALVTVASVVILVTLFALALSRVTRPGPTLASTPTIALAPTPTATVPPTVTPAPTVAAPAPPPSAPTVTGPTLGGPRSAWHAMYGSPETSDTLASGQRSEQWVVNGVTITVDYDLGTDSYLHGASVWATPDRSTAGYWTSLSAAKTACRAFLPPDAVYHGGNAVGASSYQEDYTSVAIAHVWPATAPYAQTSGGITIDYTYQTDASGQPISSEVIGCAIAPVAGS